MAAWEVVKLLYWRTLPDHDFQTICVDSQGAIRHRIIMDPAI
jgi:hypothetical protein